MKEALITDFLIYKNATVKQAMKRMSDIGQRVIYVVDKNKCLVGSLSDGDIRKWIIHGHSIRDSVSKVCYTTPISVPSGAYRLEDVKKKMLEMVLESIPVIDSKRSVVGVLTWDRVFSGNTQIRKRNLDMPVVIMAGGKGTRLDPFTRVLPKPLIPINDKPIIEIIMNRFVEQGATKFFISISDFSRMIKYYFKESVLRKDIHFIDEKKPLGTAGCLGLIKDRIKNSLIVTNCDILIDSDYSEIVNFHKEHGFHITMVVSCRHYVIPYGVCEIQKGGTLKDIHEKPEYDMLVNTGMYVIEKNVLGLIPHNKAFNMTELIMKAKSKSLRVGVFPISESAWTDVGQWEEYRKAISRMGVK